MDLLGHFMEELSAFEGKLGSALVECRNVVSEVQDSLMGGGGGGSGSSGVDVVPSMMEKLLEQLTSLPLPGNSRGNGRGGTSSTSTSGGTSSTSGGTTSTSGGGGGSNALDVAQSWNTLLLAIKGSHASSLTPFLYLSTDFLCSHFPFNTPLTHPHYPFTHPLTPLSPSFGHSAI